MWWGQPKEASAAKEMATALATGSRPLDLHVSADPITTKPAALPEGLRSLYENKQCCDVAFVVFGERFLAHKVVLAAASDAFRKFLLRAVVHEAPTSGDRSDPLDGILVPAQATQQPSAGSDAGAAGRTELSPQPQEFLVENVSTPEAMEIVLQYVYRAGTGAAWDYRPTSLKCNRDVLCLAGGLGLTYLHEHAARWLAEHLDATNCVEGLVTCEEFGLGLLRGRIIGWLSECPSRLALAAADPEITNHPRVLQDLLMQVTMFGGCGGAQGGKQKTSTPQKPGTPRGKLDDGEKPQAKRSKRSVAGG